MAAVPAVASEESVVPAVALEGVSEAAAVSEAAVVASEKAVVRTAALAALEEAAAV